MHIVGEVSIEMRQSPAALRNAVNQDLERLMGNTSAPVDRGASLNNISPLNAATCRCAAALRIRCLCCWHANLCILSRRCTTALLPACMEHLLAARLTEA